MTRTLEIDQLVPSSWVLRLLGRQRTTGSNHSKLLGQVAQQQINLNTYEVVGLRI